MSFVSYWSRSRLRTNWRSSLALVLLIGLAGGTVLALVAGGLRTDSAYPRFAAQYLGADATMFEYTNNDAMVRAIHQVANLPHVVAFGQMQGYSEKDGTTIGGPLGPGFEHTVGVPRLLSGRLPTTPDEIALDWTVADQLDLGVGDTYRDVVLSNRNGAPFAFPMRVVGVAANTLNFPPYSTDGASGASLVASSFFTAHERVLGHPSVGVQVRLDGGQAAVPAFSRAAVALFSGAPMIVQGSGVQTAAIQSAIHPAAIALWLLGGSLALVAGFILYQLLGRLSAMEEDLYATASALGATHRQLIGVELARTALVAIAATVLALVTSVALSPVFPLGTARVAEPDPGVAANGVVLGAGAVLIIVLTAVLAAWPAWRTTRDAARPRSFRSRQAAVSGGGTWSPRWLWLRPVAWVGFTHGLRSGRGASSVAVRASVVSLVIAATGLTAALTFGASLSHLLDTPALYGWTWDAHIYDAGNNGTGQLTSKLAADPWVKDVDQADTGIPLRISGHAEEGVDFAREKGAISFPLDRGRQPSGADEIALSAPVMHQLGVHLGSRVPVTVTAIRGPTRMMTVVGQEMGPGPATNTTTSGWVLMSRDALLDFLPPAEQHNVPPTSDAFVDFVPAGETHVHLSELERQIGSEYKVYLAEPPTDILNFGRVQDLPVVLALLLTALASATLFITLLSSAHRRRTDLAVLKTLGYRPRQLRAVVVCQSTAMTAVGLTLGIPIGIALGRLLWMLVAEHLGIVAQTVIPGWQIAVMTAAALTVATVAAAWPGRVAARTPAAMALHAA
jgi:hypothetical protein